jgi:hypothetical protein
MASVQSATRGVLLLSSVLLTGPGCDQMGQSSGAGSGAGTESMATKREPTTGSETAPERDPSASSSSDAGEERALAGFAVVADKVEEIIEAYRQGGDIQAAAGDWAVPTGDSEFQQVADRFREAAKSRGVDRFEVAGVSVKIGYPKSGAAKDQDLGVKRGQALGALILTSGSEPAEAAVRTETRFSGTTPVSEMPGPKVKSLGQALAKALQSPKSCESLPIATQQEIEQALPEVDKAREVVRANPKAAARLRDFCDALATSPGLGAPEMQLDEFVVVARDGDGEKVGHLEFGIRQTGPRTLGVRRWPEGFSRPPGEHTDTRPTKAN